MELRDKDKSKWHGKGVTKAVSNINNVLAPELVKAGLDPVEQVAIDTMMLKIDGTENKNNLGANAILGVSMAVCKAGAAHKGNVFPFNITNCTYRANKLECQFIKAINSSSTHQACHCTDTLLIWLELRRL